MSEGMANARILPIRPSVGFAAISLTAGTLAVQIARECDRNIKLRHLDAPFAPSFLYGCVFWMWWVGVTFVLWTLADRWAGAFKPSAQTVMAHFGASCVLATAHLALLQHTVWFASSYWPIWGRVMAKFWVESPERFGVELVIYGFISGMCAFLSSRMQTQQALVQKLEIEHQKLELEKQLTTAQLKALQMQMEPHFLFNTLNAITSLVDQHKNEAAMETLAHLNTILRTTLQRRSPEKVPFTEELELVESYLAIQKVRFADRINIKIDTTPEARRGLVPCFLLQPLVENAVRHGIERRKNGGSVHTKAEKLGNRLWMQVRNDGHGVISKPTDGHGIGLTNIRERLAFFYPGNHQVDIETSVEGGYQVTIQIPFEEAAACN
jgi:two-component sensor histidine kinase